MCAAVIKQKYSIEFGILMQCNGILVSFQAFICPNKNSFNCKLVKADLTIPEQSNFWFKVYILPV